MFSGRISLHKVVRQNNIDIHYFIVTVISSARYWQDEINFRDQLCREIREWCTETFGVAGQNLWLYTSTGVSSLQFIFWNPSQAALFKLRFS